ncbi:hypothetical protein NBRC116601_01920 [Cognatishimia sp. WU-CL00825]
MEYALLRRDESYDLYVWRAETYNGKILRKYFAGLRGANNSDRLDLPLNYSQV